MLPCAIAAAQQLPPLPSPMSVPKPGPAATNGQPYAPQPILPGGIIVPLWPTNSPYLKQARVGEAEVYNMTSGVPGRIDSIVNIHNPSIEVHRVDRGTEYRRGGDPGGGRRAQHAERRIARAPTSSRSSTTTA